MVELGIVSRARDFLRASVPLSDFILTVLVVGGHLRPYKIHWIYLVLTLRCLAKDRYKPHKNIN